MRTLSLWIPAVLILGACGSGATNAPAKAVEPSTAPSATEPPRRVSPSGGSSDGVTCEQARDSYHEEVNVGGAAAADLNANDFAAVLNTGTYLNSCSVPGSAKVRICAAIQNGHAVGITVATEPSEHDMEVCVAGEVRKLTFPSNAKMDFVNVTF